MERLDTYDVNRVLEVRDAAVASDGSSRREFDGEEMRFGSDRYTNFPENGITCVECGLTGQFFAKECHDHEGATPHFNLYAMDDGIHLTREGQIDTRIGSEADLCGWDVECVLWDDWHFTSVEQVPEELSQ